jgi:hypothetical protein
MESGETKSVYKVKQIICSVLFEKLKLFVLLRLLISETEQMLKILNLQLDLSRVDLSFTLQTLRIYKCTKYSSICKMASQMKKARSSKEEISEKLRINYLLSSRLVSTLSI